MIEMQRRLLYLLFHIDTNVINARGKLASMNQIEKWAADEVILVNISGVSFNEALAGNNHARTKKALAQIFTITDVDIPANDPLYQKIESAIFPGGAKTQNQKNDVKVVFEAAKYGAVLITNEGGSKTQPGGILGNRDKLRGHLTIYSDEEAVQFIRSVGSYQNGQARIDGDTQPSGAPDPSQRRFTPLLRAGELTETLTRSRIHYGSGDAPIHIHPRCIAGGVGGDFVGLVRSPHRR